MGFQIKDNRGNYDTEPAGFTDGEVLDMIRVACRATSLPIPKAFLLEQGIRGKQLEQLLADGLLSFVLVQDSTGKETRHYYPAEFEAYRVSRALQQLLDELKTSDSADTKAE